MEVLIASKPPLQKDADGVFRIGGTRVRLDTVIIAFQQGLTPEAIGFKYPVLQLADIYAVVTYYLQHREEVEGYLARRQQQVQAAEREIEARFSGAGVRERLLARRGGRE